MPDDEGCGHRREGEIPKIRIGQEVEAKVAGFGTRVFKARVNYMASSLDPATRRLAVRSEVDNPDRVLRPEMFATFTIITGKGEPSPSVPVAATVYERDRTHVWVARPDGALENDAGLRCCLLFKPGTELERTRRHPQLAQRCIPYLHVEPITSFGT